MDTNIHNNSLNGGGGNNNVIVRIPSTNEYDNIILNNNLNGNIDASTSKSNVWNFISGRQDYTILQNNTMSKYTNRLWNGHGTVSATVYYVVPKTYISGRTDNDWISGDANFRPIFEFNQE